jgi:hypothetical protein
MAGGAGVVRERVSISFAFMPSGRASRVPARLAAARSVPPIVLGRRVCLAGLLAAVLAATTACSTLLPKQYEYEEEVYLSLDGSATIYVNASVPALVALRGLPLDLDSRARVDRATVRRAYSSPVTSVTRVTTSRRHGRRFVHLRLSVSDIRRLGEVAPFAWSQYALAERADEYVFTQTVGAPTGRDVGDVGWTGDELVAFRLHLPSKIRYHNAPSRMVERGNILAWEQPLSERLAGRPVRIEVRLDTQSILYRTLWLFGLMMLLVGALFVVLITWIVRKGRSRDRAAA